MVTLLQENIRFSMISTRMEDSLAVSPLMDETERQVLDSAFVDWFESSSVQSSSSHNQSTAEMPGVTVLKNVMRWRYLSSRVILHRPVLLWYAMRKMPFEQLSDEKKAAVDLCRDVTAELIDDIATTWKGQAECQVAGWNATWLIYQAVMVPLLSLFSDSFDSEVVERSQYQVDTALTCLRELEHWSATAKRSIDVVSRISEASRRHRSEIQEQSDYYSDMSEPVINTNVRPSYIDLQYVNTNGNPEYLNTPSKELYMDNMFDSLNWSTGWTNNDYPFVTPSLGWDHQAMNGWGASTDFDGYFNTVFTPEEEAQMSMNSGMQYAGIHGHQEVPVAHYGNY